MQACHVLGAMLDAAAAQRTQCVKGNSHMAAAAELAASGAAAAEPTAEGVATAGVVGALMAALDESDVEVRAAAAAVLQRVGSLAPRH
jgi:hypothetical protein